MLFKSLIRRFRQIKEGDILECVNGARTENWQATNITQAVRGKPNTRVILGLRRAENRLSFAVQRDLSRAEALQGLDWDRDKAFGHGHKPSGRRTFLVL